MGRPSRADWRRLGDRLITAVAVTSAAVLLAVVAGRLAGHQLLIDRSDSMRPSIAAGDLLLTETIRPAEARVREIVTFAEPGGAGRTITHRVVSVRRQDRRVAFATRGDANSGIERWSVEDDGTIGRTIAVVPNAGYVVDWLGRPLVRFAFVVVAGALLGAMLIRSIWA